MKSQIFSYEYENNFQTELKIKLEIGTTSDGTQKWRRPGDNFKNEENPKYKKKPNIGDDQNDDNPNNEDKPKNEDNLKDEDDHQKWSLNQ